MIDMEDKKKTFNTGEVLNKQIDLRQSNLNKLHMIEDL